jgi:hypothetical protein
VAPKPKKARMEHSAPNWNRNCRTMPLKKLYRNLEIETEEASRPTASLAGYLIFLQSPRRSSWNTCPAMSHPHGKRRGRTCTAYSSEGWLVCGRLFFQHQVREGRPQIYATTELICCPPVIVDTHVGTRTATTGHAACR